MFLKNLHKLPTKATVKRVPFLVKRKQKDKQLYVRDFFVKNSFGYFKIGVGYKDNKEEKLSSIFIYGSDLNKYVALELKDVPKNEKVWKGLFKKLLLTDPESIDSIINKKVPSSRLLSAVNRAMTKQHIIVDKQGRPLSFTTKKGPETTYSFQIDVKSLLAGLTTFFSVLFGIIIYLAKATSVFQGLKYGLEEHLAASSLETKINEFLFQNQTGNEPEFVYFDKIKNSILNLVKNNRARALILAGPPGMSKTYTVRRTLHFAGLKPGKDYIFVRGATIGMMQFYQILYDNRDKLLILDDFDAPLKDEDMVNILKAITDSYSVRVVTVPMEKFRMALEGGGAPSRALPSRFEFKGKVLIITNMLRRQIDKALLSRAPSMEVNFDMKKLIKMIKLLMNYIAPGIPLEMKQDAYRYLLELYKKYPEKVKVDFRVYQACVEARAAVGTDWKDVVRIILGVE